MKKGKIKKIAPSEPPFTTTHKLPFESAPWFRNDALQFLREGLFVFRVGTCSGTWRDTGKTFDIIAIVNEQPGNGHLNDVFEWFEYSCRRNGRAFRILEIMNERFRRHLIVKRGFTPFGKHCIKIFE